MLISSTLWFVESDQLCDTEFVKNCSNLLHEDAIQGQCFVPLIVTNAQDELSIDFDASWSKQTIQNERPKHVAGRDNDMHSLIFI